MFADSISRCCPVVCIPANAPITYIVYPKTSLPPLFSSIPSLLSAQPQTQPSTLSTMRLPLTTTLPLLTLLLSPSTHALPQTHYSTMTIIPLPLTTTKTIYHHPTGTNNGSSYSPSGTNKAGPYNASANISLSYTLSYPTTNTLPLIPLPTPHQSPAQPSNAKNATTTSVPGNPGRSLPTRPCAPGEIYCNTPTSFSLCAPPANRGGGESKVVFMGAVANGTVCADGRIRRAEGGTCSPVGGVKCRGTRRFLLCDEGMYACCLQIFFFFSFWDGGWKGRERGEGGVLFS